jgi:hypothetical protein
VKLSRRREGLFTERWQREHRWDALGRYNAECERGIVHTAAYDKFMRQEQARFDREHGIDRERNEC